MAHLEAAHYCSTHSDHAAVARCDHCGTPFCGDCRVDDLAAGEEFCSQYCREQRSQTRTGPALATESTLLEGSRRPFASGWRLWASCLGTQCKYTAPLAVTMGCLAALHQAEVAQVESASDTEGGPAEIAVLLLFSFGIALTQVILSQRHTGLVRGNPYTWTLRRFAPWVLTILAMFVAILLGMVAFIFPGIYLALRLFWADELALVHGSNPIQALRESWRITEESAGSILFFQFLAGLAANVVFIAGALFVVALATLTEALGIALQFGWLTNSVVYLVVFVGYGAVHAPEVVRFYGMKTEHAHKVSAASTKPLGIA